MNTMRKVFLGVVCGLLHFLLIFHYSYALPSPSLSPSQVKTEIGNIQSASTVDPNIQLAVSSVGGAKGRIGNMLSNLFDTAGRIKNDFIGALDGLGTSLANNVLRWDGNKFVSGTITDNGTNVGIGTAVPSERLHVAGDTLLGGRLYLGSTDTSFFRDAPNRIATDSNLYVRSASPNTYLYSKNTYLGNTSGDTTRLRGNTFRWNRGVIQGSGNVGIGTWSPSQRLDVNGNTRITGLTGLGRNPIPGVRLAVNGRIVASNPIASNHVATKSYVDNRAPNCTVEWVYLSKYSDRQRGIATCPGGYKRTGGGVDASWWGGYRVSEGYPYGTNSYACTQEPDSRLGKCYVICCR